MTAIIDDRPFKGIDAAGSAPSPDELLETSARSARRCGDGPNSGKAHRKEEAKGRQFETWRWFARHETYRWRPWDHTLTWPTDRYDGSAMRHERDMVARTWGPLLAALPDCGVPHPGPIDVRMESWGLEVRYPLVKRPVPLRMVLSPSQVELLSQPWEPFPGRTAAMGFRIGDRVFINETATSQIRFELWIRPATWMVQTGWHEVVACFVCPTPCHHQDMLRADAEIATDMLKAVGAPRRGGDDAQMGSIRWWMAGQE